MLKHIYLTSLHLSHGGVEFVVSQLANYFVGLGHPVTILCTYKLGEPVYDIDPRVTIKYLTKYVPNREAFKKALRSKNILQILKEGMYAVKVLLTKKVVLIKEFKNIQSGIVISSRNEDTVLLSKYGQEEVLKIAHIHHDVLQQDVVGRTMVRKYKNIHAVVLLTEELKSEVEEFLTKKYPHIRCVAIANAIEPLDFLSHDQKREKTIITVGRLHPDKGYHRLLDIFQEVHAKHPEWRLQIIGDGVLKEQLMKQAELLGIKSSVDFLGYLNNEKSRSMMMKSSIYVMTSVREGFGIVLVEAMDAGLPAVAFDVRVGPRSIISQGKTGYLIEDGKNHEFAKKLMSLMEENSLREELGLQAKNEAAKYYREVVFSKWTALFQELEDETGDANGH